MLNRRGFLGASADALTVAAAAPSSYDYLIIAGGIRNDYEAWYGNDLKAIEQTRMAFPSAYIPNSEQSWVRCISFATFRACGGLTL